jgi:hypothetical protein
VDKSPANNEPTYDSKDDEEGDTTSGSEGDEEMDATETPTMQKNREKKLTRKQKNGVLGLRKVSRSNQLCWNPADILLPDKRGLLFTFTPPGVLDTFILQNISVNGKWGFYTKNSERKRCQVMQCREVCASAAKRKEPASNDL